MITLTRLNGQIIAVNPDLITWIEKTPDATISLLTGDRLVVRESLEDVIERVLAFRRSIRAGEDVSAYPPSKVVLESAAWGRDSDEPRPRGASWTPAVPSDDPSRK
jgi:flagellar protein FlbD